MAMQPAELEELLKIVPGFVRPAAIAGGFITDFQGPLLPGEETFVTKAVDKRRREFVAGRTAARLALDKAGGNPSPILSGEHREPLWPIGFRGSITHSDAISFAACVRTETGLYIGIDTEIAGRLKRDLWRMVFGAAEQAAFLAAPAPDLFAAAAFSAKESFEKAQFAASGRVMETGDMQVSVKADGRFSISHSANGQGFARVPKSAEGHWATCGDHVFTSVLFAGM
jgi:4'-phosphopantetheinyl transferase EntD